jgi:hypothetical protein
MKATTRQRDKRWVVGSVWKTGDRKATFEVIDLVPHFALLRMIQPYQINKTFRQCKVPDSWIQIN